ncbi:erythronate-4-phosphate dehydrogenase [Luminiphilus syltensis NOR5-1B]|uniref:Erythronate-4-phosphate dehydrogenase n=1 Tax=Luminiphilus syltensis NOR5-1B TaxID=565045 RepID=B8KRQ8_9GAMM|nr:4-phosphoerythronate dehydrogenase [Luminiphilus syltensis]EED34326.1 erythronate-4-phosphate dehydrogenase [Luminiphilus syltensis NOR5-1B]
MRVVCDENIAITPALRAIADEIACYPGRAICAEHLGGADALLVRSVTQVDEALLRRASLRFVGTATAGVEHIDTDALVERGIAFAHAPGANANAVVEYVLSAIAHCGRLSSVMAGAKVGVVGCGAVGSRLCSRLVALGAEVLVFDPFVAIAPPMVAATLEEVLACPIVSLHPALHNGPEFPSCGMVGLAQARYFGADDVLINAGRGPLVTREALSTMAASGTTLVLDTWPSEPRIDSELLRQTMLATPHIAGYSQGAKLSATDALVRAMAEAGLCPETDLTVAVEPFSNVIDTRQWSNNPDESGWLAQLLIEAYPVAEDDRYLRRFERLGVSATLFDSLRKNYPLRAELAGQTVKLSSVSPRLEGILGSLQVIIE